MNQDILPPVLENEFILNTVMPFLSFTSFSPANFNLQKQSLIVEKKVYGLQGLK